MNDLSLILYLADVLPALSSAVSFWAGLGAFVTLVTLIFYLALTALSRVDEDDADSLAQAQAASILSFSRWLFPVLLFLRWATYLVPTKETFYAIAVSEVGEEVLKSSEVGKARQALNVWPDKQISEPPVKESK